MLINLNDATLATILIGLDKWFDSMRQDGGYGGPVVHWWNDCQDYIGPGLDWRYEGIVLGYLNLWKLTDSNQWLSKAIRAGQDIISGQLPSGNFRSSCFELNPNTGGTPHEAACDIALLQVATSLKAMGDSNWKQYAVSAEQNLFHYHMGLLWDDSMRYFQEQPFSRSFVPNKAATLCEAIFLYAYLKNNDEYIVRYVLPTLEFIIDAQVKEGRFRGAIYQGIANNRPIDGFFPYYIARCIPALLEGYAWSGKERYADAALSAAKFISRCQSENGGFPQVIYSTGRMNKYPQWIAATGDILRVLGEARHLGVEFDERRTFDWLMAGLQADGSIRTASGFGRVFPGMRTDDPRDDVAVCGWVDKAFRYLTGILRCKHLLQTGVD